MPHLGANDIHLWLVATTAPEVGADGLALDLSQDEHERAARFHFDRDRVRYVGAHQSLRRTLARYLHTAPADLSFAATRYGKPYLVGPEGDFEFNLSHAGDYCLIAVARARRIGVDIEFLRPELAGTHIADHYFAAEEVAALRSLPPEEQLAAFYRCWTRKEAFVKARGEGLSISLMSFAVSLRPGEPAALLTTRHDNAESKQWTLYDAPAPAGYLASLCYEGSACTVSAFYCSSR